MLGTLCAERLEFGLFAQALDNLERGFNILEPAFRKIKTFP